MANRLRSLRFNVFVVILVVVLSPLVFILLSSVWEFLARSSAEDDVTEAAAEAGKVLEDEEEAGSRINEIAEDHGVRILVVDAFSRVTLEADHHKGSGFGQWWRSLSDWTFGPEGVPSLQEFDAGLGPIGKRPEVVEARRIGQSSGCRYSPGRTLAVCHFVAQVRDAPGDSPPLVYVQATMRRAIRALFDFRFQYIKLTLYNLVLALILAWWMARYIVRPVVDLRRQVLERADHAVPGAGLETRRKDEIGALTDAFNALLTALAERAKTNEEFLSDLAHEFKNPVAAVRTCAENLADAGEVDRNKAERIARILKDSSTRLDALVSEFLELAKAEAGLPGEAREFIDMASLVKGIAGSLQQIERFRDRTIEVHTPDEKLEVRGVARRLEMALRNLIDNGAWFAGAQGEVQVRARREGDQALITVADNGPGIQDEHLPRVFERFFTTRGAAQGTGLGLSLTRAIIEAHGGKVRAESQSGKGAMFSVELPLLSEDRPDA